MRLSRLHVIFTTRRRSESTACARLVARIMLAMCVVCTLARPVSAQRVRLPAGLADSSTVGRAMSELATHVLEEYTRRGSPHDAPAPDDLVRLELVARRYDAAIQRLAARRESRANEATTSNPQAYAAAVQDEIWARAMASTETTGTPFDATFASAFRELIARLDDRTSALVLDAMSVWPPSLDATAREVVARYHAGSDVSLEDGVRIVRSYQRALTHKSFGPLLGPLFNEEDARRYITERNVRVRTPDDATVCALIIRPRSGASRLPTLLSFTIYADSAAASSDARRAAANGYVGVVGFTRGKACSPDVPVPYRYDGRDAAALIDWIAARPWSDGRVGMYGGSYNGFTTWAAAKYAPKALRAIMVGAPAGPGIDVPMEGNIFESFVYAWPFYTTNNKTLDYATYNDNARWWRMQREWYVSGRAYRDLPKIDGTPNPQFLEWLAHPAHDTYWRSMIPDGAEFERITIPVLQTAGYYYGGPGAATYYYDEHYTHNPRARHYLVVGPYDHFAAQRGVVSPLGDTATTLAGYELDPVARMDIVADLRYRWFDWLLRGGPRPPLLQDRVNYEVMGANVWRHAPTVAAMSNGTVRLYLSDEPSGATHRLTQSPPSATSSVLQRVDLSNRADIDSIFAGGGVRDTAINTHETLVFVSDPLQDVEVSGLFTAHLAFVTNKKDFDLSVALFELTSTGEYMQLTQLQIRASYARSLAARQLLTPGEGQTLDARSMRLVSRKLERGSRIVAVIGPIKVPGQQINYGSGKDVSDETIADAGAPLEIRWSGGSYLELPIRR